jgi:ATP-dependent Clp protease ATP-binding subunit ClpA
MFPHNFLSQMAREHELSPEQEQVLLMRMGDERSYEKIAEELDTSADACLKRMGQAYKKFNIIGSSRGKENKLRTFLIHKLEKWEQLEQNTAHTAKFLHQETFANSPVVIQQPSVVQNLPAREYAAFVGRDREIARLMELLDFQHSAHLISVDGIGGVGKTTLVVEVAYRCLEASKHENFHLSFGIPTFEAIIFTSAKQNHLTAIGLYVTSVAKLFILLTSGKLQIYLLKNKFS